MGRCYIREREKGKRIPLDEQYKTCLYCKEECTLAGIGFGM